MLSETRSLANLTVRELAERAHVSQPTLSIAVKKLEVVLGVLLERGKTKIIPTRMGSKFVAMGWWVVELAAAI